MTLVLLVSWLSYANLDCESYDVVEMFAGAAQIARASRVCGNRAVAVDLSYENNISRKGGMDLTTPAGFGPLGLSILNGSFQKSGLYKYLQRLHIFFI